MQRYAVGILGATGLVGQHLVQRLIGHPWFRIVALAASDRSAGGAYGDTVRWRLAGDPPSEAAGLALRRCAAEELTDCTLVLSALDAKPARRIEPRLASAGAVVVSNSSAHRMEVDVPLLVPEVNAEQLEWIAAQRQRRGGGFVVTNPNCSVAGLAIVLGALDRSFGVRRAVVTTLQALSGAGGSGPRALDLVDNVVPYISGEEEKIESEVGKVLGKNPCISAHCHRVPTIDGHLEAVSVELAGSPDPDRVGEALRDFRAPKQVAALPSAREPVIRVREEPDRPQPRFDRDCGDGMTVVVGRIRRCDVLGSKLVLLVHNAVRGAAGGALLNAELLAARGFLQPEASQ